MKKKCPFQRLQNIAKYIDKKAFIPKKQVNQILCT